MQQQIQDHYDEALKVYAEGGHFDTLLEAKKEFFRLTGTLYETDDEYESRMNCFNDWYVFQFVSRRDTTTVIRDYLQKASAPESVATALLHPIFSLYTYEKTSFRGQIVLYDEVHQKKVLLAKDHPHLAILQKDIFTGNVISFQGENYLLKGLCIFPQDVKKTLIKEARKVGKLKDTMEEEKFLLYLMSLKTKWIRYGHIDITKIFIFN